MKKQFTKYPSSIYASYPAKRSEYTELYVEPYMEDLYEEWDSEEWYSAVEGNLTWLIKDLRELPEIRSVRPGKIVRDERGGYVEIPLLLNVTDVPLSLWEELQRVAFDNYFTAVEI